MQNTTPTYYIESQIINIITAKKTLINNKIIRKL